MDRKLFFSYIQNMQQNNQDMVGFQNSMRKNSWQKPKSLYEAADPDSFLSKLEDKFHKHVMAAVHGTENDTGYYAGTIQGLPQGIEDIHIKGFSDDPTSAHEGPGHSKTIDGVDVAIDAHDALTTYGIPEDSRLYSRLSPDYQQVIRRLFVKEMGNRHQAEMADREDEGRLSAADRGMTHADPHNPLRESFIQMNEVKANVHGEYPFTVVGPNHDPTGSPSGASRDKRSLVRYAAEAALKDENHWIYHPKNHNIRRALFNFTSGNTEQDDLPHIVTFMNQDPKFKKDLEELNADIEKYGHF